jgi:hypothetical protein
MSALLLTVISLRAADVTRQQAAVFERKLGEIATPGSPAIKPGLRRTPVTESELNSWLQFEAPPLLPEGVTEPQVTLVGGGKVAGHAVVDLDRVAKSRTTGGLFDPWRYLGGRVPVDVTGTLRTADGGGRFDLESAQLSGVPVPRALLQEVVSFYSRGKKAPQGVRLDDAFTLPAGIQQIELGQGRAVVVQ